MRRVATGLTTTVRVSKPIIERYPDYRAILVRATDVVCGPSSRASIGLLLDAEAQIRYRFSETTIAADPHVVAWRRAYASFGAKPSRYHCSVEALARRALKRDLAPINLLVDAYNAVSLMHMVPIGGEDSGRLAGDLVLRFATGVELFETAENGGNETTSVEAGEVIWADDLGVTCRRWNWRQCDRTAIGNAVGTAYFVIDALDPCSPSCLDASASSLAQSLQLVSPGCHIDMQALPRS